MFMKNNPPSSSTYSKGRGSSTQPGAARDGISESKSVGEKQISTEEIKR